MLEGTSGMTQVDLLGLDTGKLPQSERDFSAESNIIAGGQTRKERNSEDFPGGPLVENPPASASRAHGSSPWSGKTPHATQHLSP